MKNNSKGTLNPSRTGWVFLIAMIVVLAAFLRLWQLDAFPAGLYRDEAFNGLDALSVLNGERPLFFTANNGREPSYIYLTAVSIALFGRSLFAIRFAAAVTGILTTLLVYKLAHSWFDRLTGILAAFIWATTVWSIHLSRIGLRPILLVFTLTLTFWLATEAYRRQKNWLWLLAGFVYGLGFYTYLAIRFTPILLAFSALYLIWQKGWYKMWRGGIWFVGGTAVTLTPLLLFYLQNQDILLGRTTQVSIFSPSINNGDLLGTFLRQVGRALGMFVWQGDTILRHNPAGRPVFDWLMLIPFFIGLIYCFVNWRKTGAALTLLWIFTMLWVTILAEDAPHFLRAVGVLPAALFLPAIGLAQIWRWQKLPAWVAKSVVLLILFGSLMITTKDYVNYSRDPQTALLFEAAATQLAYQITDEDGETAVYLDRWFWDEATQKGWPSIPFLADLSTVNLYRPELGLPPAPPQQPITIYAWKFYEQSFAPQILTDSAWVQLQDGALARGDLEENAYPLYIRLHGQPNAPTEGDDVNFSNQFTLHNVKIRPNDPFTLEVDLLWEAETAVSPSTIAFVQIIGAEGILAQSDLPPGGGNWLAEWWQTGQTIQETRTLTLPTPYDPATQTLLIGLYDSATLERLPILAKDGSIVGDSWAFPK